LNIFLTNSSSGIVAGFLFDYIYEGLSFDFDMDKDRSCLPYLRLDKFKFFSAVSLVFDSYKV